LPLLKFQPSYEDFHNFAQCVATSGAVRQMAT